MKTRITKAIKRDIKRLGYDIKKSDGMGKPLYTTIYPKDSIENQRFYNVGAGSFKHPFWTNIDFKSDWYEKCLKHQKFINHDLFSLKKLPIPDNSAEIVYTSHTIEHINNEAAQTLFNEAFRILKPGGIFRMTTPDIDLNYRAYRANDRHYYYWIHYSDDKKEMRRVGITEPLSKASIGQIFLSHFATQRSALFHQSLDNKINDEQLARLFKTMTFEDALDHCTSLCNIEIQMEHPGNHLNWWNERKAIKMLKVAGFPNPYLSGYGQSHAPVLRNTGLFDSTHPKISLYVEAIKEESEHENSSIYL